MKNEVKFCKWCHQPIDKALTQEEVKERIESAIGMSEGMHIYNAIVKHKAFRSIDLCNFDYTMLSNYRKINSLDSL